MLGFQSRKKFQDRATDLLITASTDKDLANKSEYFDTFMEYYDEILNCFKELCEISEKVPLKGITGDPKSDYYILKHDQQWHMRDALEREHDRIVAESKTKYRNNQMHTQASCEYFKGVVEKYQSRFDDETLSFAKGLLKKLFLKFHISLGNEEIDHTPDNVSYDFDSLEGHEFENWCANLLKCNGFEDVEVTQGSGDQGVDIIAEKDEIRYAIQCKCYSSDLGNTPVQEVCAGKKLYRCQIGVVMTNRYFTKGARELAESTGILLWDRDKILKMLNTLE